MPSVGLPKACAQRREVPNLGIKSGGCLIGYFCLASVSGVGEVGVTVTP